MARLGGVNTRRELLHCGRGVTCPCAGADGREKSGNVIEFGSVGLRVSSQRD